MFRLLLVSILLSIIFASACSSNSGKAVSAEARRQLDLQDKCGTQARAEFDSAGFEKYEFVTLTNHYNQKLDKCFTQLSSTDAKKVGDTGVRRSVFVIDAFDGKSYGEFSSQGDKLPPAKCKVVSLSGGENSCHSEQEFRTAMSQYME